MKNNLNYLKNNLNLCGYTLLRVTNNKILSDGKSSWYLVDYILRQPDFLKRYVNIRSIIKDTIK